VPERKEGRENTCKMNRVSCAVVACCLLAEIMSLALLQDPHPGLYKRSLKGNTGIGKSFAQFSSIAPWTLASIGWDALPLARK